MAEGEHELFNSFMIDVVKGKLGVGRHESFWTAVRGEGLTLISTEEDSGSSIHPNEAIAFLANEDSSHISQPIVNNTAGDDDMFGSME